MFTVGLDIYKELQNQSNAATMNWLGHCGPHLDLDEIVDLLSLYSLVNPDLQKYHTIRKNVGEGEDTITHQVKLQMVELRNLNICYALFRCKNDKLLQAGKIINFRSDLPSVEEGTCTFSIGYMCDNYEKCRGCIDGKQGKNVIVKETFNMGKGLFANESIDIGDYITPYEGKVTKKKPKFKNNYVVEIRIINDCNKTDIRYLNGKNSSCPGRFANHSCINNALRCKMIIPGRVIPTL